jgi:transposase-like protein
MSYPVYNIDCNCCGHKNKAHYRGTNSAGVRYVGKCQKCGKTIEVTGDATWLEEAIPEDSVELRTS